MEKVNWGNNALSEGSIKESAPSIRGAIGSFSSGPLMDLTPHDMGTFHTPMTDSSMGMTPYGPPYGDLKKE